MKKKLLASLLIAVVFVCTFVFGANAAATEISTPEQLLELMTETSTNLKGSYVLTKNIDMSEMEGQSPIGTATYKFTGTFDGAGYTISGLNIDTTSDTGTYPYAGLFGLVNKGTIKNLTVEGTITGKQSAGGIAGWARGATIINCHNYATVTTTSTSNGAGGILGFGDFNGTNISVAITNCTNHGNITAGAYAGGIYGLSQERTNTVQSLVITGCKNYGNVTVNSGNVVGGIVGYHRCSATTGANVFTINECANYGAISATSTATNKGNYAGGIIGAALVSNNVTSTTITLTNLYNEGSVNAVNGVYEGGIGAVLRIPLTSTGEDGNLTTSFVLKNWIQNGPETGIGALATFGSAGKAVYFDMSNIWNKVGTKLFAEERELEGEVILNTYNHVNLTNCFNVNSADVTALLEDENFVLTFDGVALKFLTAEEDIVTFPYTITTAEQLIKVMNSPAVWGGEFILGGNISLDGVENQAPIGSSTATPFTGSFNGMEYTVSGLNITGTGTLGFFGAVKGATIENLTVDGTVTGTGNAVAGLVAYTNGATIENCVNKATVTGNERTAGIVGSLDVGGNTTVITNCVNEGTITANGQHGAGIAGRIYGCAADGELTVTDCANKGDITGTTMVGGLVGRFDNTSNGDNNVITITNFANYGNITASDSSMAGGLAGILTAGAEGDVTSAEIEITNVYNSGSIIAETKYAGGFAGYFRSYEDSIITVTDIYNKGTVKAKANAGAAGGFFGAANGSNHIYTITNAYNCGSVTTGDATVVGPITAGFSGASVNTVFNAYYLDNGETYTYLTNSHAVTTENYAAAETFTGIGTSENWLMTTTGPELALYHVHTMQNGTCTTCGEGACQHTISAATDAVWEEAVVDGDTAYNYVCANCGHIFLEGAEKPYIYVDNADGVDTNTGLATDAAVKTIQAAVAKMTATGGDVILTTRYKVSSVTDLPAYEKEITFTSLLNDAGNLQTGFVFTAHGGTFNLNGPTKFESIIFNGSNLSAQNNSDDGYYNIPVIAANWNDLTVGPRVLCYGVGYIVAGSNGVSGSERDLGGKTVNITLHRTVAMPITDADSEVLTPARPFYTRVYLGDRVRVEQTDAYTVKNVNINFTSEDATFDTVWFGTTSNATANAQMENYNVVANFNGISDAYIHYLFLGDGNTSKEGSASIDNLTINLNGTSYVTKQVSVNNVKNLTLNISPASERLDAAANVLRLNKVQFYFSVSTAYGATNPTATANVSYGTHSFANGVGYPLFNKMYGTVAPEIIDECDYNGTKWTYNETDSVYELICPVCEKVLATAETPVVYVGDGGDDNASGLTAATRVATITEAVTRLADVENGTVMFTGLYTLDANEELPEWSGTMLFTADPDTHDQYGAANSGIVIAKQNVSLSLGGKSRFDAILFKGASSSVFRIVLSANYHDIEMGYIRAQNYAKMYLLAGVYYQKTDDTEPKTSTMVVDGPGMSTNSGDYLYERVYLGSIYLADNIEVSNKTVTATFRDGYINSHATTRDRVLTIGTLYMMSTAGNNNFKHSTTNGCTSTVYVNENSEIRDVRTGDRNVNQTESSGKMDNIYFYFNDNSNIVDIGTIQGTFYVRNAVNTYVYISDMDEEQAWEGEGVRTEKFAHSVFFQKYGTFTDKYAAATLTYGTHSFIDSIVDPVQNLGDYDITRYVNDECEGNWDDGVVTTAPTASKPGVKTYTCTVCGRTRTEEVEFVCTSHVYLKIEDGSYVCGNCGIALEAPTGSAVISAVCGTVKDGAVSVDIIIDADAIAGSYFTVTAPDGFTLASVSNAINEANGFQLVTPDTLTSPACKFMLVNFSGNDGALDEQVVVTLNYTVADTFGGTGEIKIECHETINAAEADIETVTVNAAIAHEHNFVKSDLVPDTADKAAHYVYTCSCGDSYEEVAQTNAIAAESIKYGTSATLTGDFELEFLVQLSNDLAVERGWLMVEHYIAGVTEPEVTVVEAHKTTAGETATTYRFMAPAIAAKEMNDKIVITFCAAIGGEKYEAVSAERNLVSYYNVAFKQYYEYAEAGVGQAPAFMNVFYAMFNYGAAAQDYFGYNAENPVNAVLPEGKQATEFTAEADADESVIDDCANDVYTISDFYAVLEQKIEYALVFSGTAYSADSLVFKGTYTDINGNEDTIEASGENIAVESGKVTVYINTVSAKDLRQMITGALYHTDGTQLSDSVTFSFAAYAKNVYTKGTDADKNICAAILNYSDAAKALFYKEPTVTE